LKGVFLMGAANLAIEIEQGADFQLVVTVVGGPASLVGYTGAMQIRTSKAATDTLYDVPVGKIAINNGSRQVTVTLPWTETVDFDWDGGLYDLVITSGDGVDAYRIVEGKVSVDHSVTRADA
jgi:hypothetical protein